ncbi:hypothetical protein [Streptomyces sp. NPDC094032]|uniref:hypothetical protein n=1 Tax=Streptomyces sp. NPDC094032 TaxID=3155308 RepID=UPI00331F9B64
MHVGRAGRSATRAGGALAHLLLVVVLALGVFVMHSVGHPEGSSGADGMSGTSGTSGMDTTAVASDMAAASGTAAASVTAMSAEPLPHGSPPPPATPPHHEGSSPGTTAYAATHGSTHGSGTGMDMTTLCVAVLGVWLLAALLRAALGRRADGTAPLLARLLPFLGPNAPPRPPDLAQLSILRI